MIPFIGHPSFDDLNRYADGDLRDARRARVAGHLADCSECRRTVSTIRGLGQTARTIPVPTPPDDALSQILARRDAGDRVLLPVEDIGAPRRQRPVAASVAAAAAVMAFFLVALAVWAPTASADLSRLSIAPERPPAGETLELSYDGTALFPEQDRLIVRARYRTADGEERLGSVGQLVRDDGDFQGRIDLPDDVVYAAFAVEDMGARQVDSNGRRFWEVLVHEDGKPAYAALRARADELERRDLTEAYATIRRMTRLYPTEVEGWLRRLTLEKSAYLGGARDSIIDLHWRQFQRFENALAQAPARPDQVAWMAAYAEALGHPSMEEWFERARAKAPEHPLTIRLRTLELTRSPAYGARSHLALYDSLWIAGHHDSWIAQTAFSRAVIAGLEDQIEPWFERYNPQAAEAAVTKGALMAEHPSLRERGISELRDEIQRLREVRDSDRALYASETEQRLVNQELIQRGLTAIGTALLETPGRQADGLQSLRDAIREGWNPENLLEAAMDLHRHGDRESAVMAIARAAALPETRIEDARLTELVEVARQQPEWQELAMKARRQYHQDVMARSVIQTIPDFFGIKLSSATDGYVALETLMTAPATGVAILTPFSLRRPHTMQQLAVAREAFTSQNLPLVTVILGSPTVELERVAREHAPGVAFWYDFDGRLGNAFNAVGSPDFFVVDSRGRIRFQHVDPEDLATMAAVLSSLTAGTAVATSGVD